jgi:hypothetical protein
MKTITKIKREIVQQNKYDCTLDQWSSYECYINKPNIQVIISP